MSELNGIPLSGNDLCQILEVNPFPFQSASHFDILLKEANRARFTTFVALYAEVARSFPDVGFRTGFNADALDFIVRPVEQRRGVLGDAVFRAWAFLAMRAVNRLLTVSSLAEDELEQILREFSPMLVRVSGAAESAETKRKVQVIRSGGDPLIHRATPPSYDFPDLEELRRLEQLGHPTSFFRDVIRVVIGQLATDWPELHARFATLIQFIYYLPDAKFRSCSASRYGGVVLLAAKDASLRDIAETLVHEWGHQLLYLINEAAPLVADDDGNKKMFRLPWSGQERDLYGYFHAFFIYTLLVKYFDRTVGQDEEDRRRIEDRSAFIVAGLSRAASDLHGESGFTPAGRTLLRSLITQVASFSHRGAVGDHAEVATRAVAI